VRGERQNGESRRRSGRRIPSEPPAGGGGGGGGRGGGGGGGGGVGWGGGGWGLAEGGRSGDHHAVGTVDPVAERRSIEKLELSEVSHVTGRRFSPTQPVTALGQRLAWGVRVARMPAAGKRPIPIQSSRIRRVRAAHALGRADRGSAACTTTPGQLRSRPPEEERAKSGHIMPLMGGASPCAGSAGAGTGRRPRPAQAWAPGSDWRPPRGGRRGSQMDRRAGALLGTSTRCDWVLTTSDLN